MPLPTPPALHRPAAFLLLLLALAARPDANAQVADITAAAASAPEAGAPATYRLDPTHTFVHWEVVHMGTSTIRGRFDRSSGNVAFDAASHQIDVGIVIDTGSVNSGVPVLDGMLRGAQMLSSTEFPQAYFTARRATWDGDAPRDLHGEFTLRGTSQPLTLRALRWHCGLNPVFRREVCGGDFEAEFDRSGFGITYSLPFVADRVRLLIQVEAVRL